MPVLKVSHIVSFSSEDLKFPACNLLKSENYRKWKCKDPGEKEASVILQLEKAEKISSIDIGNESSAFVEVLVGRSSQTSEDFKVLLLTSSFMTPMESRNATNTNRVRMFAADKLDKTVQKEKWDKVKVVCTQPYNKHIQYGLSFIKFHSESEDGDQKSNLMFGGFSLKEETKDEEFKAGSLFAGFREKQGLTLLKGAAVIREASTSEGLLVSKARSETKALLKEIESKKKTEVDIDQVSQKKKNIGSNSNDKRNTLSNKSDDESGSLSIIDKDILKPAATNRNNIRKDSTNSEVQSRKRQRSPQSFSPQKKEKNIPVDSKKLKRKPFKKLLEDVVFVISGFQNPLRGELRTKALEMGAKYKPDWNDSCTHLVCAFPNTPKFMQVLGKGYIVNSRWIEDGYSQRRRLPWRRYAMAKHEQGKEESEEEILEDTGSDVDEDHGVPEAYSSADRGAPSGSDTDDEINRCLSSSVAEDHSMEKKPSCSKSECFNCETEDESEDFISESSKNGKFNAPHFPDFFSDFVFYIHPKVDSETRHELCRHIVANKGKLTSIFTDEVTHVLTDEESADHSQLPSCIKDVRIVKTNWIWDCHDVGKLIPIDNYLVQ